MVFEFRHKPIFDGCDAVAFTAFLATLRVDGEIMPTRRPAHRIDCLLYIMQAAFPGDTVQEMTLGDEVSNGD
jgi:hypothetical protein